MIDNGYLFRLPDGTVTDAIGAVNHLADELNAKDKRIAELEASYTELDAENDGLILELDAAEKRIKEVEADVASLYDWDTVEKLAMSEALRMRRNPPPAKTPTFEKPKGLFQTPEERLIAIYRELVDIAETATAKAVSWHADDAAEVLAPVVGPLLARKVAA
jgi:hypothetical protein